MDHKGTLSHVGRGSVLVVVFGLIVAACGGTAAPATTSAPPPTAPPQSTEAAAPPATPTTMEVFKAVYRNGGQVLEVGDPNQYLPRAFGWYKDLGLDMTVGTSDGSAQAIQLLISGDADFVQVVPSPLVAADSQGADLVAVCTVMTSMNARLGVLPDSDITSIADLKGKTIGVASPTSSGVFFARAAAVAAGLDPDTDISIVPAGFGASSLHALQVGDVDALSYWTGYFADLEAASGVQLRQIALEETQRAPGPVIVTRRSVIENQPELVGRFLRAVAMSQEFAYANPEAAVRAYWNLYPEDKPTGVSDEEAMAETIAGLNVQLSDMAVKGREDERWCWNDPQGWDQFMNFAKISGAIDLSDASNFDISTVYTNDFIAAANDFDAEAIRKLAASQ